MKTDSETESTSPPATDAVNNRRNRNDAKDPLLFLGASCLIAMIAGLLLFFFPHSYWSLACYPIAIFGRFSLGAIGLRVAKWQYNNVGEAPLESTDNMKSIGLRRYSIIETVAYAVTDAVMYLPLVFAPLFPPLTTLACVILGIISEMCAQLSISTPHHDADSKHTAWTAIRDARCIGPATGKIQALVFATLAFIMTAGLRWNLVPIWTIRIMAGLLVITIIRRTNRALNAT